MKTPNFLGFIVGVCCWLPIYLLLLFSSHSINNALGNPIQPNVMENVIASIWFIISIVTSYFIAISIKINFSELMKKIGFKINFFEFIKKIALATAVTAKKSSRKTTEILREADIQVGKKKEIKTEEDAYERAAEELEEGTQNKGIWAKAFSDAKGDEQKQKALYIKYRAEQLIEDIV